LLSRDGGGKGLNQPGFVLGLEQEPRRETAQANLEGNSSSMAVYNRLRRLRVVENEPMGVEKLARR